jgi:hypothetical protein
MSTQSAPGIDDVLLQRVCGEFLEMPGLCLTRPQAQRLWALDEETCRLVLDFLVEARFLCRLGHDAYARPSAGVTERPRLPSGGRPAMAQRAAGAAAAGRR